MASRAGGWVSLGGQPAVLGHRAKLWLFSASTVSYSTQLNVLHLLAAAALRAAEQGGGAAAVDTYASQRERRILVGEGLVTVVRLFRRGDRVACAISRSLLAVLASSRKQRPGRGALLNR